MVLFVAHCGTFDCCHSLIKGVFVKNASAQADYTDLLTGAAVGSMFQRSYHLWIRFYSDSSSHIPLMSSTVRSTSICPPSGPTMLSTISAP